MTVAPGNSDAADKAEDRHRCHVSDYMNKEQVVRAEIIWALNVVKNHYSYKSCEDVREIFKVMFPDSDIACSYVCDEKPVICICMFDMKLIDFWNINYIDHFGIITPLCPKDQRATAFTLRLSSSIVKRC